MSKQVQISETFKINIDAYGNHEPEYFKAGGDVINTGKNKGEISEDKWVKEGLYFNSVSKALLWGVKNGKIKTTEKVGDMTAMEYLAEIKRAEKEIKELVNA